MYVPSRLRCSLRVRTITAFTTLPFCTCPSGAASFTAAVIMSPRPAFSPVEPPSGRITCSLRAPELSATSSMLLIITAINLSLPSRGKSILGCPVLRPSFGRRAGSGCPILSPIFGERVGSDLDRLFFHRRHLRGLAHNFLQLPALQLRQRTRLFDLDH